MLNWLSHFVVHNCSDVDWDEFKVQVSRTVICFNLI